ncbi:hypothetical protein EQP59_02125 [Ornithobacterium rhinotracheale]|uniref:Type VI secretion system baseplate subunit TssF n=1 Tax=Ornithobacterium rhinotracheale TaxID=28251 RepID=A0A3R5Y2I7_ORNRH|nr:type VI secretion system baseplate subunit TssF [Ornithobacterium rhinotracheale]QAR30237.1 hypothetical protein EQP59_02125 [Ornithobacterium rhinotracheale]
MSKDHIKDRILRRAAKIWGYNELVSEHAFDPIVNLLLSALASELEKLDYELENSRSRIMERILEVLFPEEVTGVVPARTLLQIDALKNNQPISFYNKFRAEYQQQNIYDPASSTVRLVDFSPTIEAKLTTARLRYIAYGNKMLKQESFFFEDIVSQANIPLPSGVMWGGLDVSDAQTIEDLLLYITINNEYQKELFYHYLKQVKVIFNGKDYRLYRGYNIPQNLNISGIMKDNYNEVKTLYNEVNQHFEPYFYTIKGILKTDIEAQSQEGQEKINLVEKELFTQYFTQTEIANEENIAWIKFEFSEIIAPEILQNVRVAINCVPVINNIHTEVTKRIKGSFNLFPIVGEGVFLGLDYVKDDFGNRLDTRKESNGANDITAVLRRNGVSRFDSRNALELLNYVLELIKDETAAFSSVINQSNVQELHHIQQNLASLEQTIKEQNITVSDNPYLVISGANNREIDINCHISYWHTYAEQANAIKAGSVLKVSSSDKATPTGNAIMLLPSFGGRKSLSPEERILEYRYTMLSRGRIVTEADIEVFAWKHFKNTITQIEIKKGTQKEVGIKNGFSRTLDLYITKNTTNQISNSEWKYLCDSFLIQLKNNSANVYPYRIFVI